MLNFSWLTTNWSCWVGWYYACIIVHFSKNWVAPKDWETRRSGRRGGRCRCVYHHRLICIDTMIPTIYFLLNFLLFWYNILLFNNVIVFFMIQTILFVFVTTYLQHMLSKYIHSLFWGPGSVSSSGLPRFLRGLGALHCTGLLYNW